MRPERWQQIKKILDEVLNRAPEERNAFLLQACGKDLELRKEVEAFMEYDTKVDNFLTDPIFNPMTIAPQAHREQSALINRNEFINLLEQMTGHVLDDKYLIEKKLGEGGMGAVYLATHIGTGRPVALKVIAPQFMANEEFVERFKREAKAAGLLRHPNVVNVTDFGFTNTGAVRIAYLVMEYLNGHSLGELLKQRGKLPLCFVLDIVEQICLALNEAHNHNIIHRDLKPDNIWLEPNGRGGYNVKVLDFGLAKLRTKEMVNQPLLDTSLPSSNTQNRYNNDTALTQISGVYNDQDGISSFSQVKTAVQSNPNTAEGLTSVGTILGTPLYMSPEQCSGYELDTRSDIYSLGIIIYQMLAGETPFQGSIHKLLKMHKETTPPSLKEKQPDIPTAVADLIMLCLSKDVDQRPLSPLAFANGLRFNAEGDSPLQRESTLFYRIHFAKIFTMSATIFFPAILICSLIMAFTNVYTLQGLHTITAQVIEKGAWLLSFIIILFASSLNIAANAIIWQQADKNSSQLMSNYKIILSVFKKSVTLFRTFIYSFIKTLTSFGTKNIFKPSRSLLAPAVVILENRPSLAALQRSGELTNKVHTLAASLQLKKFITEIAALGAILLVTVVMTSNNIIYGVNHPSSIGPIPILGLLILLSLVPTALISLLQPIYALAICNLYVKARKINGEVENSHTQNEIEKININGTKVIKYERRKARLIAAATCMIIIWLNLYYIFVPPIGVLTSPTRIKVAEVPANDNAWTEYALAIDDLLGVTSTDLYKYSKAENDKSLEDILSRKTITNMMMIGKLTDTEAVGPGQFTAEQEAYIKEHSKAIEHLLAGTKRPQAQYYSELPDNTVAKSNFIQIRQLCILATAQARKLTMEGKNAEAIELYSAVYRFSTDMAEPNSPLYSALITIVCRGIVYRSLFYWLLNNDVEEAAIYAQLAQQLNAIDKRILLPYESYKWGGQYEERSLENILLLNKGTLSDLDRSFHKLDWIKYTPGLKLRVYESIKNNHRKPLERLRHEIENWEFADLYEKETELHSSLNSFSPFYSDILANYILNSSELLLNYSNNSSLPIYSGMKSFYYDRVNTLALQALLACKAYNKKHGHYPTSLEQAMSDIELPMIIDPVTKKPVSYRLKDGSPVIWFAGIDGIDDGGRDPYSIKTRDKITAGKDVVFNLTDMSHWFKFE